LILDGLNDVLVNHMVSGGFCIKKAPTRPMQATPKRIQMGVTPSISATMGAKTVAARHPMLHMPMLVAENSVGNSIALLRKAMLKVDEMPSTVARISAGSKYGLSESNPKKMIIKEPAMQMELVQIREVRTPIVFKVNPLTHIEIMPAEKLQYVLT
jgi:hypothetical protein